MPTVLIIPCWLLAMLVWAGEPLVLDPAFLRIDLQPQDVTEIELSVRADAGTRIQHIVVDCACVRLLSSLPATVPAAKILPLRLRVTGIRPGIEEVIIGTSAGTLRGQIQIVGPGAGRGRDELTAALAQAKREHLRVLAVCHHLRGQVRHCGCSLGALGGAGRLARLPALSRELAPEVVAAWVLSGDADGKRPGVGAALTAAGWTVGDPSVLVSDEPLPLLTMPGIVAVIPTVPVAVNHRRILRPLLSDGLAIEVLLVDAAGVIQARRTVPIDDSLPDDPGLAAGFREPLTRRIDPASNPSQSCIGCHASAGAAWAQSRHALALDSLKPEDRTDGCISCHVTPITPAVVAPAVSCQSCHQGGEAHAASQGKLRTSGTADCRSCHDAKHHPAFRWELAWPKILHGREPAAKP
jgi:hypothetical protein